MPSSWEKRGTPWIHLSRMPLRMLLKNTRSNNNNRLQSLRLERKTRRLPQPHRQLDKKENQLVLRQHLDRLREPSLNNVEIDLLEEIDHQGVIVLPGMDKQQETGLRGVLDLTFLIDLPDGIGLLEKLTQMELLQFPLSRKGRIDEIGKIVDHSNLPTIPLEIDLLMLENKKNETRDLVLLDPLRETGHHEEIDQEEGDLTIVMDEGNPSLIDILAPTKQELSQWTKGMEPVPTTGEPFLMIWRGRLVLSQDSRLLKTELTRLPDRLLEHLTEKEEKKLLRDQRRKKVPRR